LTEGKKKNLGIGTKSMKQKNVVDRVNSQSTKGTVQEDLGTLFAAANSINHSAR